MAPIHNRMPVVIPHDSWATWLDPTPREPGELRALLEPRDDVALAAYAVVPLVNNVRNNGPELVAPVAVARGPADPVRASGGRRRRAPGSSSAAGCQSPIAARNAVAGSSPTSSPSA